MKNNHENIQAVIESYRQLVELKKLKRTGWLLSGVDSGDCESVAEHSFAAAFTGFLVAGEFYPELDAQKVLVLGLIHDLGEAVVGDVLPWEKEAIDGFDEQERAGALQTAAGGGALPVLTRLYDEYYHMATPEAKLVHQMDKLEMLLQAYQYEQDLGLDLSQFFEGLENGFFDGKLQAVLDYIMQLRQ